MNKTNHTFSIREIFSSDSYLIPIYQRNYAWETSEVKQLIQDTADYAKNHPDWDYYIGTLIVLPDSSRRAFETIDGQQRLTTLYIILCALKNWEKISIDLSWFHQDRLTFDNRENSCKSLGIIYNDLNSSDNTDFEEHIVSIYKTICPSVESICDDLSLDISSYINYLLSRVRILRIGVPEDINKNHYFEVMNSRGVQLEQHEVVKANLMSELQASPTDMYVFKRIWEACSNMERYVQMNFRPEERRIIFGEEWTSDPLSDFDKISAAFSSLMVNETHQPLTLRNILDAFDLGQSLTLRQDGDEDTNSHHDEDDQFYSVINFQNFLLHVLKIYLNDKSLRLDDKQLTDTFLTCLSEAVDKTGFVKGFAICLLKCRYLFDKFVVRRQNNQWCLKKIQSTIQKGTNSRHAYYVRTFGKDQWDEENQSQEEAIVLLSMFHVSTPTMIYKNWLHGVLHFVYSCNNPSMGEYVDFLRKMASTFMLDRYLMPKEMKVEFMDIIYDNDYTAVNSIESVDWSLLDQGVAVENFIFNYYDYLLWKEKKPEHFEFSYRTSVEHFYPQHPSGEGKQMDPIPLNMFGNLCLISSSTNSKFTNNMPEAKLANFKDMDGVISQSLKLQEMFNIVQKNRSERPANMSWTVQDIEKAEEVAISLFKKYLYTLADDNG